jgi:hypothetical protein
MAADAFTGSAICEPDLPAWSDPVLHVDYAARFLRKLRDREGD